MEQVDFCTIDPRTEGNINRTKLHEYDHTDLELTTLRDHHNLLGNIYSTKDACLEDEVKVNITINNQFNEVSKSSIAHTADVFTGTPKYTDYCGPDGNTIEIPCGGLAITTIDGKEHTKILNCPRGNFW